MFFVHWAYKKHQFISHRIGLIQLDCVTKLYNSKLERPNQRPADQPCYTAVAALGMRRGGDAWNERDLRIVSDSATPINQSETAATEGGRELGSEGEGLGDFASTPPLTASAASDQTPRPQSFDTTSANVVDV